MLKLAKILRINKNVGSDVCLPDACGLAITCSRAKSCQTLNFTVEAVNTMIKSSF